MVTNEDDPRSKNPENTPLGDINFLDKLNARQQDINSDVCLGLDSELERIPQSVKHHGFPYRSLLSFNMQVVREASSYISAIKPNAAFYEALGVDGHRAIKTTVRMIQTEFPEIPIIYDAKRGDVGNTSKQYAKAIFDELGVDAITLHPTTGSSYFEEQKLKLGALKPFFKYDKKGIFVLCRTSNSDAGQFQDLPVDLRQIPQSYKDRYGDLSELGEIMERHTVPLYLITAYIVSRFWNEYGNIGLVVGATYPEEAGFVRKVVGDDILLLIPGMGTQEGDDRSITLAQNSKGRGIIVNSSSGIIFASADENFAVAAKDKAMELRDKINSAKLVA